MVISLVTTGASLSVFGECEAVTTTGSRSIESRTAWAKRPSAGMDSAMPATMECKSLLFNNSVTVYFFVPVILVPSFVPVKVVAISNGILPYFKEYVTATALSLNIIIALLMV